MVFNQILRPIAKWYQGRVNTELAQFGLRYHDCLVETDNYLKAVERLPMQEQIDRQRRIKRAADISLKKKYLAPASGVDHVSFFYFFFYILMMIISIMNSV